VSFGLLLPGALLALAVLVLPVLLHLVRQSDRKRVEFAALRWLTTRAQPRRRPRIDEWTLLLLRLVLLALVALWLAQPVLHGKPDARPWLLVHPSIAASRAPPASSPQEQRRWLAPGFPSLEQPAPRLTGASISSLLREIDAALPSGAAVQVLVPAQFDATDAERPLLQRALRWTVVSGTSQFASPEAPREARVAMHADLAHRAALPFLRAASVAWASGAAASTKPATLREMLAGEAPRPGDTHLLWLAAAPVPETTARWVKAGGVALLSRDTNVDGINWSETTVAWRGVDGMPLAQRVQDGKGAWIRLLAPFNAPSLPALLEAEFPRAMQDLLGIAPDFATRASAEAYAPSAGLAMHFPQAPRPLGHWIAWFIAMLFGVERWLASSPRRFGR